MQRLALGATSTVLLASLTSACADLHVKPITNATANANPAIEKVNWYSPEQRAKEAKRQNADASRVATSRATNEAAVAIRYARSKIGIPYLWGGTGTASQGGRFDCSGLAQAAYAKAGVRLPRVANDQWNTTDVHPSWNELKPGDLVFFGQPGNSRSIHHVGIYIGDGEMIHAPRTGTKIRINKVHYMNDYFGATRVA